MGSCVRSTPNVTPIPRLTPGAFLGTAMRSVIQARSVSDGIVRAIDAERDAYPPAYAGGFSGNGHA